MRFPLAPLACIALSGACDFSTPPATPSTPPTATTPPAPPAQPPSVAPGIDKAAFLALGIDNAAAPPLTATVCSGQMTPAQFDQLRATGIRRVVSLRRANEDGTGWEEERSKQVGIEFVRIEIAGADDLTDANVQRLAAVLATAQPTLVACGSSNRVGAMLALKARSEGASAQDALQLGKQCGLSKLEAAIKQKLGL